MRIAEVFAPIVCTAYSPMTGSLDALYPEEKAAVPQAVRRRIIEFATGRICARRAVSALGGPVGPIVAGKDRAPVWPKGIVGSISHSQTRCVAAAARQADGIKAIGVDIEEAVPLDLDLADVILTNHEKSWLQDQQPEKQGILLTTIFSAKECAYKCQYPLSGRMLDFTDIRIILDIDRLRFAAHFAHCVAPFGNSLPLSGVVCFDDGHIMCGMIVR